jgi:hypothetical protein
MAQDSDVIDINSRRTVRVERVEEDELEVVDDSVEEAMEASAERAKRTVEKTKTAKKNERRDSGRTLAEQVGAWRQNQGS